MGDMMQLTARQLLSRGRLAVLFLFALAPPFLAALYAAGNSSTTAARFLAQLNDNLTLTTVLPILALIVGTAAFGNEVEDGTILYLLMKPQPRWRIVTAKLVVAVVIVAVLTDASMLASALLAGQEMEALRAGLAFVVAGAAGSLAYTTIFLYIGLITSRALVIGLIYVFLWEGALTGLFAGLRLLSVRQYARGIAAALADLPTNVLDVKISVGAAVAGVAVVTIVAFALAVRRLDVMDVD